MHRHFHALYLNKLIDLTSSYVISFGSESYFFLTTPIENPGLITMTTHIFCLHLTQDERSRASNTCPG